MTIEDLLGLFNRPADFVDLVSRADGDEYLSIVTYLLIRDVRSDRGSL